MKTFIGSRDPADPGHRGEAVVTVLEDGKPPRPLNPRLDLWNYSPTGFEWGYGGSGPAQLALALAAEVLSDDEQARMIHQILKWELIVGLPQEGWALTEERIVAVIHALSTIDDPDGD